MRVFEPDSDLVTGPVVPGAPEEPELHVNEIQGSVLPGFNTRHLRLLGIRFDGSERARGWLGAIVDQVSTLAAVHDVRNIRRRALCRGEPRPSTPVWTSVAFSADGLRLFTADVDEIRELAFLAGMAERGLGDPPPGVPGHRSEWVIGGSAQTIPHALVTLAADDGGQLASPVEAMIDGLPAGALIFDQEGEVLTGGREHFGFRDGLSQPGVRGRLSEGQRHYLTRRYVDPEDPRALTHSRPGQPLLWPGQFVFGYSGQRGNDAVLAGVVISGGPDWMNDGSFLVFRRLRQDVPMFRSETQRMCADAALPLSAAQLAGRLVGRWPNGTALMRNPDGDDPDPTADQMAVNYFGFDEATTAMSVLADRCAGIEDRALVRSELRSVQGAPRDDPGHRCPRFAHIRKVNPRDVAPTDKGGAEDTLQRAILRRGMTWGAPYPGDPAEQATDDGDRGLLFLAYQTRISKQFEVLNNDWMNGSDAPEGNAGQDLLVGQRYAGGKGDRQATLLWDGTEVSLATDRHWVIPTGGGYFFTPSISTLRAFAGG